MPQVTSKIAWSDCAMTVGCGHQEIVLEVVAWAVVVEARVWRVVVAVVVVMGITLISVEVTGVPVDTVVV